MSTSEWAKKEIELACKYERGDKDPEEWDYGCACYESAYKAFQSLMEDGHSRLSISSVKDILIRLIDFKPLTPIEDTPDIWGNMYSCDGDNYVSYQCKRMSSLFKHVYKDGTVEYTDVDRLVCVYKDEIDGFCWHSNVVDKFFNELYPITMPYYPFTRPWIVQCTECLSDPKNGDFDTIGIWSACKPNGEYISIEKFLKETDKGWTEISRNEYNSRFLKEIERRKKTYGFETL